MRAGSNSSLSLVILVRKPPNSLISPGCYIPFLVVRACRGIFERGGSRNSHDFAYLPTFVDKKYVIGDGYYTSVPIRILFQKI